MTTYEFLIIQKNTLERAAAHTRDGKLSVFYANAARGYEIKSKKLTLREAAK